MAKTIKEEAMAYSPKKTKNVADLAFVPISMIIQQRTGKDKDGKEFNYKVIVQDGEEYRVPETVLGDLKNILVVKPKLSAFKVIKTGTGMNTNYTVVPIE